MTGTLPTVLRRLSAVLLTLATMPLAGTSRATDVATPIVSGLTWRSGANGDDDFGGWRGRPLDMRGLYPAHKSWQAIINYTRNSYFKSRCNQTPLCVISLPMFPHNVVAQFQACAGGSFDTNYRLIATNIAAARKSGVSVRIGWEANGPKHRPWHIRDYNDVAPYKACWRRIAGILKAASPGILAEWSNAKKGSLSFNVMETYPGDDVVDIISAQGHDSGPRKSTQAIWDTYANKTWKGGPWGINTWLAEAKKHGKKFAVPEWAVWRDGYPGDPDNPVYIANMFRFFQENAADIAYESYHNMGSKHQLYPSTELPLARAEYQRWW
jgi:hypothetical protein